MKQGPSIKRSLKYIGLPLVLSILLLVVLLIVLANQRTLELNNLETRSELQATLFAEKISGKLNALEILLDSLAQQTRLMDLSTREGEELLEHTVRQNQLIFSEIEGICILTPKGEKQFSSFYHESAALDAMRMDLTKCHIEQEFSFSSLPFTDQEVHYLSLSRSIEDASGMIARIVALIVCTDLFHEQLNLTSIPGIEQLVVSDSEEAIVALWSSSARHSGEGPEYVNAAPGVEETTLQAGIRSHSQGGKLYTTTSLAGFPYTLTLKVDIQNAMASYDKALTISFSFLLVMVLISVIYITRLGFEVARKEIQQEEILDSLAQKVQERTVALKRLSEQDALTGLPNRRRINNLLTEEIRISREGKGVFSLLILDIDRFKLVNDTYGHQTGDEIIIAIVELLCPLLAGTGTLARWGGDELMTLLPGQTLCQAVDIAQAMRTRIEQARFPQNLHITLSIGVTQFDHDESDVTIIRRADMALYKAKDAGRNQVHTS
ncbi:MAG: GGDEF domain-containing protein [Sphaerochaeta sp.]|nr:GGDEF domain-containing protein [Sphaerochaeta sp.]